MRETINASKGDDVKNKNGKKPQDKPHPVQQPTVPPPGVVLGAGHGPRVRQEVARGSAHLRELLGLRGEVSVEDLCEEAASRIEALAKGR